MNQPLAMLFPGQGSQFVGMGKSLFESAPAAREIFQRADQTLGFPLTKLCFEGPEEVLNDTVNTQPAIFTASCACWEAMQALHGPLQACFLAGHSLGEYTALVAAGCFSFEDGLRLVRLRGQAMKAAGERLRGGMAAVLKLAAEAVETLCREATARIGGIVQIANDNCPGQVVISGDQETLDGAMQLAREQGGRVVPLAVSVAAHSPLMESAVETMREALESLHIGPARLPVIGNVSAELLSTPAQIRQELLAQLTSPVRWTQTIERIRSEGGNRFVEVGPGKVLAGLVRRIAPQAEAQNVGEWPELLAWQP
ncbi:MAG: ACP S-malonyltransferase [Anaerolineae bacterium]